MLANIKFAIYNVDEGEVPAKNSKGETIGTKEIINGREYYTISTDANGEITADLQEGFYKAVEVQAPEKYDLNNQTHYFGIGASREGKIGVQAEWAKSIGKKEESGNNSINSVAVSLDGSYIVGGYFSSKSLDLGNGIVLDSNGDEDGIIIKYNYYGEIEWTKVIGGNKDDEITSIAVTEDGDYIVVGNFKSAEIDLENGINIRNSSSNGSYYDVVVIKYDSEGRQKWAKKIGNFYDDKINSIISTKDGGYIVGGNFESDSINLGNGITLTNNSEKGQYWAKKSDGMIIKYSSSDELEWAKSIGGIGYDEIKSVSETSDGRYIAAGYFEENIDLGNEVLLTSNGSTDGMIAKYSSLGELEWIKKIGSTYEEEINTIVSTSDNGFIVGGYFKSADIDLGNNVMLKNSGGTDSYGHPCSDGMIIKYGADGNAKWAHEIGGNGIDEVRTVCETSDRGIIVGGYFKSHGKFDLGNDVFLIKNGDFSAAAMIIKYSNEGKAIWSRTIGGVNGDYINSLASMNNTEAYLAGGNRRSAINLGDGVDLWVDGYKGFSDGMVIKFKEVEFPEVITKEARKIEGIDDVIITSVLKTEDEGYVIGGYFEGNLDLKNGVVLEAKGRNTGMLIKYDSKEEIEWARTVGTAVYGISKVSEGGYLVAGYCDTTNIDFGNGIVLKDSGSMILKYSNDGIAEWVYGISASINSVCETKDGGYIVGGTLNSESLDLGNGIIINSNGSSDGLIIKYTSDNSIEWAKALGGDSYDSVKSVYETSDGGYVIGVDFNSKNIDLGNDIIEKSGLYIIKYNSNNQVEWKKWLMYRNYGYMPICETSDGGYVIGIDLLDEITNIGGGIALRRGGHVIKTDSIGNIEWAKGVGGSGYITSVLEIEGGKYIVGGYYSSEINLGNGIVLKSDNGTSDCIGIIFKINPESGAPEVEQLTVENKVKEFEVTTKVRLIDGIKGGSISGEDMKPYEKVKYGNSSTKEIKMIPDENYEIISITINGEEYPYEVNEDGSYTIETIENITEDKHIEVTYSLKDNKITINKVDSKTKLPLKGAEFKLDQIEERSEPESAIGTMTDNGQNYDAVNQEMQEEIQGSLTNNGQEYSTVNKEKEVTDVFGELTNNGTYYFVEQDGKYIPTNGKTYQLANGGTAGKSSTTANSYIPIDLTGKEGKYAVEVNAQVSSESSYDFGYATITETTSAPSYSNSNGRFLYVSGTLSATDYTSAVLEGGKTYYLHLGYRKDGSGDKNDDQIEFNSIKLYEATGISYNFEEIEGKYIPSNISVPNTCANSYIPIDLTNKEGKYAIVVNAETDYTGLVVFSVTTAYKYPLPPV